MKYYKLIENGVITLVGIGHIANEAQVEITNDIDPITGEEVEDSALKKYEALLNIMQNHPEDTFESVYYLDAETETYLPRERTEPERIDWFVKVVSIGTVKLEEVPIEYRAEVESRLPVSEEEQWANEIMEEVSEYGY